VGVRVPFRSRAIWGEGLAGKDDNSEGDQLTRREEAQGDWRVREIAVPLFDNTASRRLTCGYAHQYAAPCATCDPTTIGGRTSSQVKPRRAGSHSLRSLEHPQCRPARDGCVIDAYLERATIV
jgi:hypothetical protein